MNVLYILIPLALLLVGAAVVAFIWAVNSGQFDDTRGPAVRLLIKDDIDQSEDGNGTGGGSETDESTNDRDQ